MSIATLAPHGRTLWRRLAEDDGDASAVPIFIGLTICGAVLGTALTDVDWKSLVDNFVKQVAAEAVKVTGATPAPE